jgi:hypothetical protein
MSASGRGDQLFILGGLTFHILSLSAAAAAAFVASSFPLRLFLRVPLRLA